MLQAVILFVIGLLLLIKGGDWFVDGASGIAHKFRMPELLIGATVVSIGTTLPEIMVSATSAVKGYGEIAYGNAIGSIICNTALIAALTIAIKPGKADGKALRNPVIFFFASAAIYCFTAYFIGKYTRSIGVILLAVFAVYMISTVHSALPHKQNAAESADAHRDPEKNAAKEETLPKQNAVEAETLPEQSASLTKLLLLLIVGAAAIAAGANFLVDNGTIIAKGMGVPESVIALTFVALGTSLPELVTAISSLIKGHSALSLGNIIGANLFNLVLVSGLSITLNPFDLPGGKTIAGINASLIADIPVMLAVMLILTLPALLKGKLYRAQGIVLLCIYAAFLGLQFMS